MGGKVVLEIFYPDEYVESAYSIDYQKYFDEGYRGVIFDIDNTLVPHGAPADARAVELFQKLGKIGFKSCLISNNKESRVRMFNKDIATLYIFNAHKPSKRGFLDAVRLMGTDLETTLFVGDQLFTDVYGARRAGLHNILVKPIHPKEEIQIVLKRKLERIVLWSYRRSKERKGAE